MSIAEQLTRAKADLDAVYEAGKKAGGGVENRREYSGTIAEEVRGTSAYVELCKDDFLTEIRTLDTLFVRVECKPKELSPYTILKNWATNVYAGVMPTTNNYTQVIHRLGSGGADSMSGNMETLYSTDVSSKVGLVNITEDGELRLYSGSPNYAISPCDFKVIVEW